MQSVARIVALAVGVVLLFAAFVAPALARSIEEIRADGVIRVGINPNFPPMSSFGMTNQLEGFDVDVGNRIAEELGVKAKFVPTEAAQRVPFLTANRVDIVLGALTRTPERAAVIDFTIPLHTETMGVLATDKLEVQSWRDLNRPDVTLVNMRGNRSVALLDDELPHAKKLLVDANADTVRAIAQGRADALVENIDFFLPFTKHYGRVKWTVIDDPIFVGLCAVGLAKGDNALREALDDILLEMHESGYVSARWEHWFGSPMASPLKAEQLMPYDPTAADNNAL